MRVISGIFKNKEIKSPESGLTHPMGSREKLALFNMISPYIKDSVALDAYAGSGALGIEMLSRGAKKVVFLEKSGKIAKIIRDNLSTLLLPEGTSAEIITSETSKFASPERFDVILADPPYDDFKPLEVANLTKFLKNGGIFVLSSPKTAEIPVFDGLELTKTHTYAAASISIYTKS